MAFLQASPTSTIKPIWVKMLFSIEHSQTQMIELNNQNDRERQRPAFVKRREQEKNEQNAERENIKRAVAGERLLERDLRPFGGETGGQNLFGETFNRRQRITGARAGRRLTAQIGRREHVVARDFVGAAHFLDRCNRTERNNSARIISRFQQANVVGFQTELRVGLSGD